MYGGSAFAQWACAVAVLALLLLSGAVMTADITRRRIPDTFCAAIAGLAILHAFAYSGWSGFADVAIRTGTATLFAVPLCLLFAVRALGGGDVKLFLALLLWVDPVHLPNLLAVTVFAGAMIAIGMSAARRIFCFRSPQGIPYGVAIVVGALVVILPQVEVSATTVCAHMV